MNKAVELFETVLELFQRNPFRAVVVLWLTGLTVFFLLNTMGFLGSSWDACEDESL